MARSIAFQRLRVPLEVHLHVPVPRPLLPLPMPPVQIPGVEESKAVRRHQKRLSLVGGGQGLNAGLSQGADLPAPQGKALCRRLRADAQAAEVPGPDVVAQHKADVPYSVVQGEDPGVEVVLVAVAGKDVQGNPRPDRREPPLPPVKQQRHRGQLRQKAAVAQECDGHHRNFTAVP